MQGDNGAHFMSDLLFLLPSDRLKPLSLSAVGEILDEVKLPPLYADRELLRRELALANRWQNIKSIFDKPAVVERAKRAMEIADQADILLDLLLESSLKSLSHHKA